MNADWRHPALCNWFAGLFAVELTQEQLLAYQRGEGDAVLSSLAELPGLASTVQRLRNAFTGLTLLSHSRLELAADFAAMFLMDGQNSAPPYASFYSSEGNRFFAEPQERMQERLAASQQEVSADFREPSDHLSVMLEYLGEGFDAFLNKAEKPESGPTLDQIKAFIEEELLNWLPAFAARCEKVSTVSDLYPALAVLLLEFLKGLPALDETPINIAEKAVSGR
ncbi:molecular chaperone TorD [Marinobacter sp. DY40_1A1]|uniref:molecular chaperone TorD n=1 Tax=Marinobacter sp. DY40_1A1 TaxID=2583229 RepID=UPI0019087D65|nr:molecular chaperone TorD [Marinobacter sp. DY40_1A1]MBK1885293.1 molecular chaperone TorD [Marinobacter sp. DY40_1A1]